MKRLGRHGRIGLIQHRLRDPDCRLCELHHTEGNVCVMGRGNPLGPIALIGEAPGAAEAKTGKPFMGRAGKWLNERLDETKLTNHVFITNVVRCRPPQNRDPTDKEIKRCSVYLESELQIVKPSVVIAMGKVACAALGFEWEPNHYARFVNCRFFDAAFRVTWHPAYCLRAGRPRTHEFITVLEWAKQFTIHQEANHAYLR